MLHFCPSHYTFWWPDICGQSGVVCCCCKWPVKRCCIGPGDAIPYCRQFNQLIGGDDGWLRHMITCNLLPGHASGNIIANGQLREGQRGTRQFIAYHSQWTMCNYSLPEPFVSNTSRWKFAEEPNHRFYLKQQGPASGLSGTGCGPTFLFIFCEIFDVPCLS